MSASESGNSTTDRRVNEIVAEYLQSIAAGDLPDRGELLARHADLAQELSAFFSDHDRFQQAAAPLAEALTLPPSAVGRTAPAVGTRVRYFGDYELLEEIARGGMGVVYKARQSSLKRIVALKMILTGRFAGDDEVARFYVEAEAAATLDHPNIVPIFEVGQHDGQHYFSMALVDGESLARKIVAGPFLPRPAVELMKKVTDAVAYAHIEGVVHRDLKPANVLIDQVGEPHVTDFGLAKRISTEHSSETGIEVAMSLTATGQVLGTPSYMPPEQAGGQTEKIGPLSDVYSLGAILYCLLTGRPPFQAASPTETLIQVLQQEPVSPRLLNPKLPRDLETICLKCLQKEPRKRYAGAAALSEDLGRFLKNEPIAARPITSVERAVKWARRRPAIAAMTAAIVAVTAIGFAGVTWQWREAESARRVAASKADSEAEARHNAERSQQAETEARATAESEAIRATAAEASAVREAERAKSSEAATIVAKERAQDTLTTSLFEQARAVRLAGLPGRRWHALELLKQAEQLRSRDRSNLPSRENAENQSEVAHEVPARSQLRTEAVAALFLNDAHVTRQWGGLAHSVSPDGRFAATMWVDLEGDTGGLAITDLATGQEISKWEGRDAAALFGTAIALGPKAGRLANVSHDMQRVTVWELPDRKLLRELSMPKPAAETPQDTPTNASPLAAVLPSGFIQSVSFSPSARYVCAVTSSVSGSRVVLWDLEGDADGQVAGTLTTRLPIAAFSPDSRLLAFASTGKNVALWNVAENRTEAEIELSLEPSGAIGFAPDGALGIACREANQKQGGQSDGGQTLIFWDVATNREIRRLAAETRDPIAALSFSADGRRVAVAVGSSGRIQVLDQSGENAPVPLGHQAMLQLLAWTDDGRHLLSGGFGFLKLWEFAPDSPISELRLETAPDAALQGPFAFSPDGRFVAVENRQGPQIVLHDVTSGQRIRDFKIGDVVPFLAQRLLFSPDSKRILRSSIEGVAVWDVETGTPGSSLEAKLSEGRTCFSFGFRADGSTVVSGSDKGKPTVWVVEKPNPIWQGPTNPGSMIAVSPDGRLAASFVAFATGDDHTITLLDLSTGHERSQLPGAPKRTMQSLGEFSPDGRWLLALHIGGLAAPGVHAVASSFGSAGLGFFPSGFADQVWTADVWHVESGKRHMKIGGPANPITYAFSRNGRFLAVGMQDGTIRLWNVDGREELFDWRPAGGNSGAAIAQRHFAFTADSTSLVIPDPVSPALEMLNLSRLNEQLRQASLDW